MLTKLAELGLRAPKRVLVLAGLILAAAAVFGAPVAAHLSAGGFADPSAQSSRANDLLAHRFNAGDVNLVLSVHSSAGAGSPAATRVGTELAKRVAASPHTGQVASYWTVPAAERDGLRSSDGTTGLVVARVAGNDSDAPNRAAAISAAAIAASGGTPSSTSPSGSNASGNNVSSSNVSGTSRALDGTRDRVTVTAGGSAVAFDEINHHVEADLTKSEAIAIPLTTIALILVFGSLLAALLPLAVGIVSIIGTLAILRGLSMLTDVSIFALNLTTALGLALAIDYSLFVVSRYREEIRAGSTPEHAVRRTMQTAGRTVLFSALTVGLSLSAMLVFPLYFLRSFAYAGIAVVALATLAALILLPAVLTLIGDRIDALDARAAVRRLFGRPAPEPHPVERSGWYRFAGAVMKRALPVALIVTAVLLALGSPFLGARFSFPDERVLPPSASAHQVGDQLRTEFPANASSTVSVVLPRIGTASTVAGYAAALSRVQHVASVTAPDGTYAAGRTIAPGDPAMTKDGSSYLRVQLDVDASSAPATSALSALRAVPAPGPALFTGLTAENADSLHAITAGLPWALLIIVLATLVVLFLFTGSLLLPIKALLLNALSLTATFGAMVWIFADGHLHGLFPNLTVTGHLDATMPPLMFCLAFGLSMDYEVFLLSRIREAWLASDRTAAGNVEAVAVGLGRTGRIVTAAAALMAIVFAAIATSDISFMMMFGTGLTLAVLMDATVVRGVLVPAFMRLAGRWNWWAPAPLTRLHARIGLHEGETAPAPAAPPRELAAR